MSCNVVNERLVQRINVRLSLFALLIISANLCFAGYVSVQRWGSDQFLGGLGILFSLFNIVGGLKLLQFIGKQRRAVREITDTDEMTGLYNYRVYKQMAKKLDQYVVLMIDIDNFKKINDHYGHLFGDKVLCGIAGILRAGIRKGDLAFRYGGEEFVVLLPRSSCRQGMMIAEHLRRTVEKQEFLQGPEEVKVTVSIGLSVKTENMDSQVAFGQADKAMYRAKRCGRNKIQIYVPVENGINICQI